MFYKGQKVRITDNTCGHGLKIGVVVELDLVQQHGENNWDLYHDDWIFDQDDCEPI